MLLRPWMPSIPTCGRHAHLRLRSTIGGASDGTTSAAGAIGYRCARNAAEANTPPQVCRIWYLLQDLAEPTWVDTSLAESPVVWRTRTSPMFMSTSIWSSVKWSSARSQRATSSAGDASLLLLVEWYRLWY